MANPTRGIVYTPGSPSNLASAPTGAAETGTQGDIICIQVTVAGTTDLTIYDNATQASGTPIVVPHTAAVGDIIPIRAHWSQGLWAAGAATAPGCVIWVED